MIMIIINNIVIVDENGLRMEVIYSNSNWSIGPICCRLHYLLSLLTTSISSHFHLLFIFSLLRILPTPSFLLHFITFISFKYLSNFPQFGASSISLKMAIAGAQRKQVLKILMISLLLDLVRFSISRPKHDSNLGPPCKKANY